MYSLIAGGGELKIMSIGGQTMGSGSKKCPGINRRSKNVPSLVSVGGIVSHHWYQWEE
ncbi:unnamed protein product [Staurois parvus]|uniref:Uncharacterized protein n=1 Tax=Staurois parvus TaxID=386267 RepID=A0ABN9D1M2_9NEOB|nr:unnamed protein product [Staurois parvus]